MRTLTRNLSRRSHSCVRVAAIVVSEMNERLSPKKAPPTTMAVSHASFIPVSDESPAATGTQRHDRSHGGADRQGDEAGGQEQSGREQTPRQQVQRQIDRGIHGTHAPGRLGEGARQYEDPDHQQHVRVGGPGRKAGDPLSEGDTPRDGHGIGRSGNEGYRNGHPVEIAGHQQTRPGSRPGRQAAASAQGNCRGTTGFQTFLFFRLTDPGPGRGKSTEIFPLAQFLPVGSPHCTMK